jgi:hypothetical protein
MTVASNRPGQHPLVTTSAARIYIVATTCIIVLSAILHYDALKVGFTADDYAQIAMMRDIYPVHRAPLSLFTFSDGSAAENQALRDSGFYPWWSHPALRISMCRPLSSALMWVDLSLFGLQPFAYHVHSLVYWLVMLVLFALLLHKLLPPAVALIALVLFAFDEAQGALLSWIALRNEILATVFGLLALLLLHRAHERGSNVRRWPALLAFTMALLAGEYALAFVGYVFVLELLRAKGLKNRALAVAPWIILLTMYLALRAAFGFGSYASGNYLDPIAEPNEFLHQASARLPVLAGEVALGLRSNFWTSGLPWGRQLVAYGVIPKAYVVDIQSLRVALERIGLFGLIVLMLVVVVAARSEAGKRARFLVLGVPLALLPVLSPFPESRVLVPVVCGFSVAMGCFLYASVMVWRRGTRRLYASLGLALGVLLLSGQLASGYYFGCYEGRVCARLAASVRESILDYKRDEPLCFAKRVLLLGAADATTTLYIPLIRKIYERPGPQAVYLLSETLNPSRLRRIGNSAFDLESLYPVYTSADAYASVFNNRPIYAGEIFTVDGMQVIVESVYQGRPMHMRFILDLPLDDPRVVLLLQTSSGLQPVAFPKLGQEMIVPAPMLPTALERL